MNKELEKIREQLSSHHTIEEKIYHFASVIKHDKSFSDESKQAIKNELYAELENEDSL